LSFSLPPLVVSEEIFKRSVGDIAWFLFTANNKMQKEINPLK
jgi:hypothetical protein